MQHETDIANEVLPDWMRRAQRGFDWGILIVVLLSIFFAQSIITQDALPNANGLEHYLFRAHNTANAFSEGIIYPRWSPHALYGFGAPIPHFYPPLPVHLIAWVEVLFTNDSLVALRLVMIGAIVFSGTAVYSVVLQRRNSSMAILSATLYVGGTFIHLTVIHQLGDLSLLIGGVLLPLMLWASYRLVYQDYLYNRLIFIIIMSALILTHIPYFMVGILLCLLLIITDSNKDTRRKNIQQFSSLILISLGLTAFYWLPALADSQIVTWFDVTEGNIIIGSHQFRDLISLPTPIDNNALFTSTQFTLGLILPVLALLSAEVLILQRRDEQSFQSFMLILGAILIIVLVFVIPSQYWLMGVISLCLAFGSSAFLDVRRHWQPIYKNILLGVSLVIILVASIPVWMGSTTQTIPTLNVENQILYEQLGFGVTTLANHALLPSEVNPDDVGGGRRIGQNRDDYDNRFRLYVGEGVQVSVIDSQSQSHILQFSQRNTQEVTFPITYFEGWQASLNGQRIPVYEDSDTGLITMQLPSIRQAQLEITLGTTDIRRFSWVMGLFSLIILIIWSILRIQRHVERVYIDQHLLSLNDTRIAFVVLIMIGATVYLSINNPTFNKELSDWFGASQAYQQATDLSIQTDVGIQLDRILFEQIQFRRGENLDLTLFWQANRAVNDNYLVQVQVRDVVGGQTIVSSEAKSPGYYPTRRWTRAQYVPDIYQLNLPDIIGRYTITIEMYVCQDVLCTNRRRVTFFDTQGRAIGRAFTLPNIIEIN